jgi:Arc/MetJ family transcription regulator
VRKEDRFQILHGAVFDTELPAFMEKVVMAYIDQSFIRDVMKRLNLQEQRITHDDAMRQVHRQEAAELTTFLREILENKKLESLLKRGMRIELSRNPQWEGLELVEIIYDKQRQEPILFLNSFAPRRFGVTDLDGPEAQNFIATFSEGGSALIRLQANLHESLRSYS